LKINAVKFIFTFLFLFFLIACSTKKNTFLARNSHALSTEYNILYNGQIALDKGIESIKINSIDNFWKRLAIERLQINDEYGPEGKPKNSDFELAETKATKAIQKHSMNIAGREVNTQMDEAYLLLGKSRYYDQRFIPSLDAFNYILYKYPTSSNIYEARIWREKVNVRLGNDALVLKNITRFLKEKEPNKQVFSDANALLAEAFLNLEEKDSAVVKLKIAEKFSKKNNQKARYRFILGQLYEELGKVDSAKYFFESVIAMNRKSERKYVIQAYAKLADHFDYQNGDSNSFVATYQKLIKDRENRAFLDVIFHHMGVFYDKNNNQELAYDFYNESLKQRSKDDYLVASNYRNLGNMSFKNTNYPKAAKYYDSTLVKLDVKTREYLYIQKNRKNLDEVIKYEAIANRNDSILNIVTLSDSDRVVYFEKYIDKLKAEDDFKKIVEEKQKQKLANIESNSNLGVIDENNVPNLGSSVSKIPAMPSDSPDGSTSTFYFYNPKTMAFGKLDFKKKWGNRSLVGNWRVANNKLNATAIGNLDTDITTKTGVIPTQIIEKYTPDYYLKQLPISQKATDSIAKERNTTYYRLGIIYKEKFKEYNLASSKLVTLLKLNPEEKLVLPTMYNLFKIYEITNANKALEIKNSVTDKFPNSRYAHIINKTISKDSFMDETPDKEYYKWYKLYQDEHFNTVLSKSDALIYQYAGEEIVSKFELLKANTIGKLYGLSAYKKAMQNVADNYPNSEEGKKAQEILKTEIPFLEQETFTKTDTKNWKIVFKIDSQDNKKTVALEKQLMKFLDSENIGKLYYSCDIYTQNESLLTIHGLKSKEYANDIALIFKENKKFKVVENATVISDQNYKIIQIKKNLEEYLTPEK
jgi:hypothetical protein